MTFRWVICAAVVAASTAGATAQQSSPPGQSPQDASQKPSPELPPVKVITAPPKEKALRAKPKTESTRSRVPGTAAPSATSARTDPQPVTTAEPSPLAAEVKALDTARDNAILPKIGANSYEIGRQDIDARPQGDNAPLDKVLLQTPGVTQDSAASGQLHFRNEHANAQFRINGILLPDGVAGFSQVFETRFIGGVAVVTGALPAQYGLHTAALVDITTRTIGEPSGSVSIYGGSRGAVTPSLEYSGTSGNTEYFFTGRYLENNVGIENPTAAYDAIHDDTRQEKYFSYVSTVLPGNARWTMITGAAVSHYQIPNNPGQPTFDPSLTFDSAKLNERQLEQNYYGVLAFQKSTGNADYQISYFSRYSSLHFSPDPMGDLDINGVASNVTRHSFVNGFQGDSAFRVSPDHTLRAGFTASLEQTYVATSSTAFPIDATGNTDFTNTTNIGDRNSKLGGIVGIYLQDEWKITDKLTLNVGARFDQLYQFVDANQISPRINLVYKPIDGTVFHAGYARNFTPPDQVIATPVALAPYFYPDGISPKNTASPSVNKESPVLPERSHVFDVGVTQKILPGFEVGVDGYVKIAKDLLDDGQFGQAYVLSGFNYDRGENEGVEFTAKYRQGPFMAYGNLAYARQVGKEIVSNQFLFGQGELDFIHNHFIYTDHAQRVTASAGASYRWDDTTYSVNAIYGSGLRTGDFNSDHVPGYTQVNVGVAHEFILPNWKPFTLRFDVVNVFDEIYEIRDGSGVGVFASQYGPRRGYFFGYSQKF